MTLRRGNRQIEVFDISLMAVVTKAMGAFLVIMLLLLPYYKGIPPSIASPAEAQKAVDDARRQIAEVEQNAGRFTEDPAALRRQLDAAQAALKKANAAIGDLKTALDQTWSQLTRTQREVADARQQMARDEQELARDRQTIAGLEAQLRKQQAQPPRSPQLMATLDLIAGPTCRGRLTDPRFVLTPEPVFVASGTSQASPQAAIANIDMQWVAGKVMPSSGWATDIQQRLLSMPASPGTMYVAVTGDREPGPACQIAGQISVATLDPPTAAGDVRIVTLTLPLVRSMPSKGPILVAAIGFDGKETVLRPLSRADVSAWSTAMGGHAPTQPEPPAANQGPFTPMPMSQQEIQDSERKKQEAEKHLLLRTPSGPPPGNGGSPRSDAAPK